ncbi:hypothetical protein H0H92_008210 [Tricholoma furcatifolium]|nr:hypothetical protein H0H92_008210 [Tricholoma furcatifolium]
MLAPSPFKFLQRAVDVDVFNGVFVVLVTEVNPRRANTPASAVPVVVPVAVVDVFNGVFVVPVVVDVRHKDSTDLTSALDFDLSGAGGGGGPDEREVDE